MYSGAITRGDILLSMLEDLADLFEQSAADRTPISQIVGDDPAAFAETFLATTPTASGSTRSENA